MNSTGLVNAATTGAAITTCCGLGTGNTFDTNDSYHNPAGIGTANTGLSLASNITTNPDLMDPANHDYAPAPGSPVAGWGLWNGSRVRASPAPARVASARSPRHAPHRLGKRTRHRHSALPSKRGRRQAASHLRRYRARRHK
jgi:hypothetical protein